MKINDTWFEFRLMNFINIMTFKNIFTFIIKMFLIITNISQLYSKYYPIYSNYFLTLILYCCSFVLMTDSTICA